MIPLIRFPRGAQASSKKIFASWLQGCSSCFSGLMPPLERCKGWNANGEGFMTGRCAKNGAPYAYIWPRTIYFYLDVAKPGRLCSTLHIDKTLNSWKTEQSGMICSKKDHLPGGFSIDLFLYLGKSEICKKSRSPEKEENLEKESENKPLMEPVATLVGSNEAPSVVVSVLPDTQEWAGWDC